MASILNSQNPKIFSLALKQPLMEHTKLKKNSLSGKDTSGSISNPSQANSALQDFETEKLAPKATLDLQGTDEDFQHESELLWNKLKAKLIKKRKHKLSHKMANHSIVSQFTKRNEKIRKKMRFNLVLFDKTTTILKGLIDKAKNQISEEPKISECQAQALHSEIIDGIYAYHVSKKERAGCQEHMINIKTIGERRVQNIEGFSNSQLMNELLTKDHDKPKSAAKKHSSAKKAAKAPRKKSTSGGKKAQSKKSTGGKKGTKEVKKTLAFPKSAPQKKECYNNLLALENGAQTEPEELMQQEEEHGNHHGHHNTHNTHQFGITAFQETPKVLAGKDVFQSEFRHRSQSCGLPSAFNTFNLSDTPLLADSMNNTNYCFRDQLQEDFIHLEMNPLRSHNEIDRWSGLGDSFKLNHDDAPLEIGFSMEFDYLDC